MRVPPDTLVTVIAFLYSQVSSNQAAKAEPWGRRAMLSMVVRVKAAMTAFLPLILWAAEVAAVLTKLTRLIFLIMIPEKLGCT